MSATQADISPWKYGHEYETNEGRPCQILGRDPQGYLLWMYDRGADGWATCTERIVGPHSLLYPRRPDFTADHSYTGYVRDGKVWVNSGESARSHVFRWTFDSLDKQPIGCVRLDDAGRPLYRLERVKHDE